MTDTSSGTSSGTSSTLVRIAGHGLPPPVSSYSHAVLAGKLLFVSGQIPVDPATNEPVGGDIEVQTRRTLENLRSVLQAAGAGLEHVAWMGVFLKHPEDFGGYNRVYGEFFTSGFPARATVSAGLLGDYRIEAWAVAALP